MSFSSARKRAGLSQRDAAKALNVSPAAVGWWDTGKTKPRASLLPAIAKLYSCSISELLSMEEDEKAETQDQRQSRE